MRDADPNRAGTLRFAPDIDQLSAALRHTNGVRPTVPGNRGRALWQGEPWLASLVPPTRHADQAAGALSSGGQYASGTGRADGSPVGSLGGQDAPARLRFDRPVAPNGYVWWYVDALSADRRHGLTIIAFVGSVFSPYYHFARQFGPADPVNHCAVNVVLYEPDSKFWCMTERRASAVQRGAHALTIGNSSLFWDGTTLTIEVEELATPLPKRVKGVIRVRPRMLTDFSAPLDRAGHHRWGPIAPVADIEVDLRQPSLRWSGSGYLDSNDGDQPLEAAFRGWHWSRTERQDDATIFYDVTERDGTAGSLALHFAKDGSATPIEAPSEQPLPSTAWRLRRATRATPASIDTTLEDGPFYARTRLSGGAAGHTMHETLSMDRFTQPWVRAMLPFRMPRALR